MAPVPHAHRRDVRPGGAGSRVRVDLAGVGHGRPASGRRAARAVAELLAVWRELRRADIAETRAELEAGGFVVNWVSDLARR